MLLKDRMLGEAERMESRKTLKDAINSIVVEVVKTVCPGKKTFDVNREGSSDCSCSG